MFPTGPYKDPDTKVPNMAIERMHALFTKASKWRFVYCEDQAQLEMNGWTFVNQNVHTFEQDDYLQLQTFDFDSDVWPWGEWTPVFQTGELLPRNDAAWGLFWDEWKAQLGLLGIIMREDTAWHYTVDGLLGIIDPRLTFFTGVIMKVINRFYQYRVAKVLQNAFCMDHRGRPV